MALIKCNECGNDVSDKAKSCPRCGYPISEDFKQVRCQFCGDIIPANFSKCPSCYNSPKDKLQNDNYNRKARYIIIAWLFLLAQAMAISNEARNIYDRGSFLKFENVFELFGYFLVSVVAVIIFIKYRKYFIEGTKRKLSIACICLIVPLLAYTCFNVYKYNHSDAKTRDNIIRERCKEHIVGEVKLDGTQIFYNCERFD